MKKKAPQKSLLAWCCDSPQFWLAVAALTLLFGFRAEAYRVEVLTAVVVCLLLVLRTAIREVAEQ